MLDTLQRNEIYYRYAQKPKSILSGKWVYIGEIANKWLIILEMPLRKETSIIEVYIILEQISFFQLLSSKEYN